MEVMGDINCGYFSLGKNNFHYLCTVSEGFEGFERFGYAELKLVDKK